MTKEDFIKQYVIINVAQRNANIAFDNISCDRTKKYTKRAIREAEEIYQLLRDEEIEKSRKKMGYI